MNRLTKYEYLYRSKQYYPAAGGGHYIYRLARRGHELLTDEPFQPYRHNVNHSLAVGECVITLHKLERAGALELTGIDYEPDCHTVIGGAALKPDLYAHVMHARHGSLKLWLEVDLATEGPKRIQQKVGLYRRAYHGYSERGHLAWPQMPRVVWVTIDGDRERKLNRLIAEIPEDDRKIFWVTTFDEQPNILA